MHSWYPFIGYLAVFILVKPILAHALLFAKIRKFRLSAPKFEPLTRETTPPAFVSVFNSVEPELQAIGFWFDRAFNYVQRRI